jgi:D-psicose/D-tagatose/L-ribulose 3-epimerase
MVFGVSSWIWSDRLSDKVVGDIVGVAAEAGARVVEIATSDPRTLSGPKLREIGRRHDVGFSVCGSFGPHVDVSSVDAETRRAGISYLNDCIDLATDIGASVVVGPMYGAVGVLSDRDGAEKLTQLNRALHSLAIVAEHAGKAGVTLALEPINRFQTDLVNTIEQGLTICESLGEGRAIALLLDFFHANIEEPSVPAAIRTAGSRIAHIHACESNRGLLGSGHIPWVKAFEALTDIGYEGPVVIEHPTLQEARRVASHPYLDPLPSPAFVAAHGVQHLQEIASKMT